MIKNPYKKLFFLLTNFSIFLSSVIYVHAQGATNIVIKDPFNLGNNLYDLVYAVLNQAVLPIGGVIVVLMMIYSGFLFVVAQGSEEKIKEARRSFTYAAIGAAILLGAVAIGKAIEATINAFK